VTYLPVLPSGLLDLDLLRASLCPETLLVSVMGVNNEIGVVQPLGEVAAICRQNKTFLHSDIAQMAGKMPLDIDAMGIDIASISSHKVLYLPVSIC
jgi:cysteine desulfurase